MDFYCWYGDDQMWHFEMCAGETVVQSGLMSQHFAPDGRMLMTCLLDVAGRQPGK